MKTGEIMAALAERYSGQEWAFMPQVRDETGGVACQTADAMAFNLWPSRGLEVIGFEVKASRSDWRRELKTPAKAEGIFARCDRWYLVVGDASIVQPGELPKTWGLMVPKGRVSMVIKVEAPKLKSKPFDRANIAAVMRKAKQFVAPKMPRITELMNADAVHNLERGRAEMRPLIKAAEDERDRWFAAIEEFQKSSGIKIDRWGAGRLGETVKLILDRPGLADLSRRMDHISRDLCMISESVKASAGRVRKAVEEGVE
jgi:hypothetical protein